MTFLIRLLPRLTCSSSQLSGSRCRRATLVRSIHTSRLPPLPQFPEEDPNRDYEDIPLKERQISKTAWNDEGPAASFRENENILHPLVFKALTSNPFQLNTATPVQKAILQALPDLTKLYDTKRDNGSRDLMCKAKTGSGKTLAFLIPAIEARLKKLDQIKKQAEVDGKGLDKDVGDRAATAYARGNVGALILAPTRELATQIASEASKLSAHIPHFEVQLITGGTSKGIQMKDWMKGRRDIVVATTGRLLDLLNEEPEVSRGLVDLQTFILDEVDRMCGQGFRSDVDRIVRYIPPSPQRSTLMFSATIPRATEQLARALLSKDARFIDFIDREAEAAKPHNTLDQYYTVLPSSGHQIPHLLRLITHDQLTHPGKSKILIFLPTTKMTMLFSTILRELTPKTVPAGSNTRVYEMHSLRDQAQRNQTAEAFRDDQSGASVMVSSDVSARGVHYPNVTRVIQLGIPASDTQYIHRIGRTGRAGEKGRSDLVLMPWEIGFITWKLSDLPIRPFTLDELTESVTQLAEHYDAQPSQPNLLIQTPLSSMLEAINPAIANLLARFSPDAIRETFMSLLGYYIPKSPELRCSRKIILEGLRSWTTDTLGMPVPPFVNDEFLRKMGFYDGRTSHFGRDKRSTLEIAEAHSVRKAKRLNSRWQMRGKEGKEALSPDASFWVSDKEVEYDPEVKEYRTARYGQEKEEQ